MSYGLLLLILFVGLGLHYVFLADVSPRSKVAVACLMAAFLVIKPWVPGVLTVLIQLAGSSYILVVYRISGQRLR